MPQPSNLARRLEDIALKPFGLWMHWARSALLAYGESSWNRLLSDFSTSLVALPKNHWFTLPLFHSANWRLWYLQVNIGGNISVQQRRQEWWYSELWTTLQLSTQVSFTSKQLFFGPFINSDFDSVLDSSTNLPTPQYNFPRRINSKPFLRAFRCCLSSLSLLRMAPVLSFHMRQISSTCQSPTDTLTIHEGWRATKKNETVAALTTSNSMEIHNETLYSMDHAYGKK